MYITMYVYSKMVNKSNTLSMMSAYALAAGESGTSARNDFPSSQH